MSYEHNPYEGSSGEIWKVLRSTVSAVGNFAVASYVILKGPEQPQPIYTETSQVLAVLE